MEKSLLEKAKEIKRNRYKSKIYSKDELELVIAWVYEEVSFTQVQKVLNITNTASVYLILNSILKQIVKQKINEQKKG